MTSSKKLAADKSTQAARFIFYLQCIEEDMGHPVFLCLIEAMKEFEKESLDIPGFLSKVYCTLQGAPDDCITRFNDIINPQLKRSNPNYVLKTIISGTLFFELVRVMLGSQNLDRMYEIFDSYGDGTVSTADYFWNLHDMFIIHPEILDYFIKFVMPGMKYSDVSKNDRCFGYAFLYCNELLQKLGYAPYIEFCKLFEKLRKQQIEESEFHSQFIVMIKDCPEMIDGLLNLTDLEGDKVPL